MEDFDYYKVKALSNTAMSYLQKSPLHLWAFLNGKTKETKAMKLGRYIHAALLEPERWLDAIFVKADGRSKEGKAYNESNEAKGGWGVTQFEYDMTRGMVGRLMQDPFIRQLQKDGFLAEQDVFWQMEGVACKAKLDIVSPKLNMLVDIKTTTDADPATFIRKSARFYDYDRQLAWYKDAAVREGLLAEDARVFIVAIEKEAPYAYSIVELSESTLDNGRRKYEELFGKYQQLEASGNWMEGYKQMEVWEEEAHAQTYELQEGIAGLDATKLLAAFGQLVAHQETLAIGQTFGSLRVKTLKA